MISVTNLQKTYRVRKTGEGILGVFRPVYSDVKAVQEISFSIAEGEIVGFLGANGAGKSTTIKMLTGVLHPTAGEIRVNGFKPYQRKREFLRSVGLMMGNRSSLQYDLPVKDSYAYLSSIYAVKKDAFYDDVQDFIRRLNIQDLLDTPVRKLSLGQRKKAELAASILHRPNILFLDEPTIGLDVKSKQEMVEFISYLSNRWKTTVLFTSHDLHDVEKVCKRIIYLDKGKIIYDGATKDFGRQKNTRKVHVVFDRPPSSEAAFNAYSFEKENEYTYTFVVDKREVLRLASLLEESAVNEFSVRQTTLEDEVLDYVQLH